MSRPHEGLTHTIAAVATPPGSGGIGIVRISGPASARILRAMCPGLPKALLSHTLVLTKALDAQGHVMDEVLAVVMPGPRSYTAEDVVEIHGHGGAFNMTRLLARALELGARMAAPGEFTQRAFLNGRLDLTQAEAVSDIINASTRRSLELAQEQLGGALRREVAALQDALVVAVTLTEAAIDFSVEEHVYQLDVADLAERVDGILNTIERLAGSFDAGRQTREGVRVVIVGRPNAGKSTLFNALCGLERAIVTPVPGTTRDYLEELVPIDGVGMVLVDTAGLREASDEVEAMGVRRAIALAETADVVLWLIDGTEKQPLDMDSFDILQPSTAVIPVITKHDLGCALGKADLRSLEVRLSAPLHVSLVEGCPATLKARLAATALQRLIPHGEGAVITRLRHLEALKDTAAALTRAREAALDGMSHEFVALDLRLALESLGTLAGHVTVDTLLNRIFAEFCVGK